MSGKDNNKPGRPDDESWGGKSLIPDDMNPYETDDPFFNTGLWPIIDSGEMQGLFTKRDARNIRFKNLIAKGRHMVAIGLDAAAEKYFRKAAEEGFHEANFQLALLRVNRVLKEEEGGRGSNARPGPDARDAGCDDVPGRRTMRKDLMEHFSLMADSVFRYADDHMILEMGEVLEKAVSQGLVDSLGPDEVARGYRKILRRHSETTWDIINYDESSAIQNFMVLLSVCRNADRYDLPGMLGVLLSKLKDFLASEEFEEFVKRFKEGE